ncbi:MULTISPECIES: hypothetical protein [unclassified Acinetobacter]|uniref:hypothetical protein n=1 Tax=unclassified Acinetobacter TaxID=196816 RepID=UPI002447D66D|nr:MULTISPECIES: hypothetical protein [unclassified Acinetobacter]MDH0032523.1 hypothetical protein [Acinetobacter sp. GD04021]MDH0885214.1 hypothetical protein [Acinetobacter sp. GD03873]MDH1084458.1 hypothetical protein [Acinetobacter sp. GD03983]MDH2188346.1 hypothetical protein [Acinetobacter sp. GD03645]MDH2203857.1 hypothetical protein [Acinetobacter sp. GD03647]
MNHTILVPLGLFRAACIAAKDDGDWNDTRNIDAVAIVRSHILGTDGRILFYSKLKNVADDVFFIIPKAYAESFIKKTECNSGLKHCQITYDTESQTGLIEIPHHHNAYEAFKVFLKVSYPDWEKVIPKQTDFAGFVRFGAEYLAKVEDICSKLGTICSPVIKPTGIDKAASIEFLYSDFEHAKAVLMPRSTDPDSLLFCVVVGDGDPDDEDAEQIPAASAELAFRASQRLRKDFIFNPRFKNDHDEFNDGANWIYPTVWNGSKRDHADQMEITEEWFSKPLKRYDNPELAIEYINAVNDCVECYNGDTSITANTPDEVTKFFTENEALLNKKLWCVNIPEEPDSAAILFPVPTLKIAKQLVFRLKKEAKQRFPKVGEAIADSIEYQAWDGTEAAHAEYLKQHPNWWIQETFLEGGQK